MHRQKTLPPDGQESLEALWQRFLEEGRREVIAICARLLALAVHGERKKEKSSDKLKD
jgi:hypothetical protein